MKNMVFALIHSSVNSLPILANRLRARKWSRIARYLLALIVACSGIGGIFSTTKEAFADTSQTVSDVLGVSRSTLVEYLKSHENDSYYLTTPYRPNDWRSPNGDPSFNGTPGMNCTGFVWHALVSCGSDPLKTPGLTGWVNLIRNNNMECSYFDSKQAMLDSGKLEKGDIIWMFDNDAGGMSGISAFHHIGFFWGDSPSEDKFWHSIADETVTWSGSNRISSIQSKASNSLYVIVKTEKSGTIELQKSSATPGITEGNTCYSLSGAQYGIYDAANQMRGLLVTNQEGYAKAENIPAGTYRVSEISPPPGYALDPTEYQITVYAGQIAKVNGDIGVADLPQISPIEAIAEKIDAETLLGMAQGSASLEDAHYVVSFYPTYRNTDELSWLESEEPQRQWVFRTDEQGSLQFNESSKVEGDEFFSTSSEDLVLPLGTIVIREVKAPVGYLLDEMIYVLQITSEDTVEEICSYHMPTLQEEVKRGDLEFIKIEESTAKRMANIPFTITSTTTGESHIIVTDDNGYASTSAAWVPHTQNTNEGTSFSDGIWFGESEPEDTEGALIYDTYVIDEQSCENNRGKQLLTGIEISITRDAHVVSLGTLTNEGIPKTIFSKVDATTGEELPGASLTLKDKNGTEFESWISAETPHVIEGLMPGDYILHEDLAPLGYNLAQDVRFSIEADGKTQRVTMEDEPLTSPPGTQSKVMPRTGDTRGLALSIALAGISSGALGVARYRKKKNMRR